MIYKAKHCLQDYFLIHIDTAAAVVTIAVTINNTRASVALVLVATITPVNDKANADAKAMFKKILSVFMLFYFLII